MFREKEGAERRKGSGQGRRGGKKASSLTTNKNFSLNSDWPILGSLPMASPRPVYQGNGQCQLAELWAADESWQGK